ncbi:MAG: ANTAR domain-containing protein [Ruminiclostridium sp.]|nr:ANTAR domain-containing protein [Ruminiclostridium sp.]
MNVLIAGKTEEICDSIAQLLLELDCDNISTFTSGAIIRGVDISKFDSVIISTPLSDEFGLDLVADISKDAKNGIVVLAKREIADEVQKKIRFTGAFVLPRPFNKALLIQTIKLAEIAHIGMAKLEEENRQLTQQLSDMKIVNRAKSMLMQYLNLTEEQAHRHIQKQAMDLRKTQRAVAEDILKTYQNTKEE